MTQANDRVETAGNPPLKRGTDTGFHVALCSFVGRNPTLPVLAVQSKTMQVKWQSGMMIWRFIVIHTCPFQ